jgi:hypothetical protein
LSPHSPKKNRKCNKEKTKAAAVSVKYLPVHVKILFSLLRTEKNLSEKKEEKWFQENALDASDACCSLVRKRIK